MNRRSTAPVGRSKRSLGEPVGVRCGGLVLRCFGCLCGRGLRCCNVGGQAHRGVTRLRGGVLRLFALSAMLLASGMPAVRADTAPDVLVIVFAGVNGQDNVDLTYPMVVPKAQVTRDVLALKANAGWNPTGLVVTNAPAPESGGPPQVMTSAAFKARNVVDPLGHYLTLEPVVTALKPYHQLALTYFLNTDTYDFRGLRGYADKYVRIMLDQEGAAYTYRIQIDDPTFQRLNLPLYQPPPVQPLTPTTAIAAAPRPPRRHRGYGWQVAMIALIATVAGATVYVVASRHTG
jgi:hypothetical protein